MYQEMAEERLLELLKAGDEPAFTEIYNRYWKKLYFIAVKQLKSSQAAEEIVQEVFLQVWYKKNTVQINSLPAYLAAMTRYAVYFYLSKESRQPHAQQAELPEEAFSVFSQTDAIDNKLLLEMIEKLSVRLPEKCRLVFVHNKLLDESLSQVAKKLDISDKTAEAHLTKALKIIRGNFRKAFHLFFTI